MDPLNIDKNLRTIKSIESSWSQAKLPDMVSLDLAAMSGLDQKNLSQFLWGLEADINKVETAPTPTLDLTSNTDVMDNTAPVGIDQSEGKLGPSNWNRFWSDIAGVQPASVLAEDAVEHWKRQAMERGRIPALYDNEGNYLVDNRWGPEYQQVWNEQTQDHYESQFRGNKYGAISLQSAAEHMGEWLSPTGLFKAAVGLDLIPDFEEIGRETTWNPLTWWKAIDDIAMPLINWGLMASGVGNVVLIGRAAYVGTKAATTIDKAYKAYKTFHGATMATRAGGYASKITTPIGKVTSFGSHVGKYDDIARAGDAALKSVRAPGWIGTKMAGSSKSGFQAIGNASAKWRNTNFAAVGKGMTQQGMRLGLAGRIQGATGLDDSGAYGLDVIPGVRSTTNYMYDEIGPSIMFEAMFTPVTMLAAGSVRALGPSNILRSFSNVGKDANVSEDLFEGIDALFEVQIGKKLVGNEDISELEAARKVFRKNAKQHGKSKAIMFHLFDDWTDIASEAPLEVQEQFGAFVTYLGTMAAVDHAALNLGTDLVRGAQNASTYAARNSIINQLRYVDPDDWQQMLVVNAWQQADSQAGFVKNLEKSKAELNALSKPLREKKINDLKELITIHNNKRQEVFGELMANHLHAGVLKEYMGRHLEDLGKTWKEFSEGMDMVNMSVADGVLDNVRFTPALADDGVALMDDSIPVAENVIMEDIMKILDDPEYLEFAKGSKLFNPIVKAPSKEGRFTVAKLETVTKQDQLNHVAFVNQMIHLRTTLTNFVSGVVGNKVMPFRVRLGEDVKEALDGLLLQVGGDLARIDIKAVDAALKRTGMKGRAASGLEAMETLAQRRGRLLRVLRYAKAQGIKADNYEDLFISVEKHMDDAIKNLDEANDWDGVYRIDDVDEGLSHIDSLAAKSALLARKSKFTAGAIDPSTLPPKLVADLEERGYKLVHGVEFATPADLDDFMVEMVDLKDATRYRESLGLEGSAFADHINSPLSRANYLMAKSARTVSKPFNRFTRYEERGLYVAALRNSIQRNFRHLNGGAGLRPEHENRLDAILTALVSRVSKEYREIMSHSLATDQGFPSRMANNLRVSFTPVVPTDLVRTKPLQKLLVDALVKGEFKVTTATVARASKGGKAKKTIKADIDFLVPDEARAYKKALAEGSPDAVKLGEEYNHAKLLAANKVLDSLKEAKVVGPQLRGKATNWLDKISANKQLTNTMRLMSRQDYGGNNFATRWAREGAGFFVRGGGTVAGGTLATMFAPGIDDMDFTDLKSMSIALVGGATGRALTTRVLVGSQSAFKAARFRDHKIPFIGKPIKGVLGNAEDATLLKASIMKVQDSGSFNYNRKTTKGFLNRWAARIDRGDDSARAGWGHLKAWSYLGDHLSMWRDFSRFTLSPVFDASRYSEAIVLGQIAAPEGVNLRFNISPSAWRKTKAKELAKEAGASDWKAFKGQAAEEFDQVRARYKNAASNFGDYDYDALEAATARFSQVGILGFNTYEWETSVFADLVLKHGMSDIDAYKAAKHMFTYGVKPRSAAEVNVNAIFFPFSFTKKTIGHAANFAMQDWSRTAMIHNSLRTYYDLDERYNLDDMYEKYLPIFDKVSRLNLLANGVSFGQFGGANRPLLDTMLNVPILSEGSVQPVMNSPILNGFLPQVFDVSTPKSLAGSIDAFERMIPLINDMQDLWDDAKEQTYVINPYGSPTHITQRHERMEGSIAAQALKETWEQKIRKATDNELGFANMGSFAVDGVNLVKQKYEADMEAIYEMYPAYKDSIAEGVAKSVEMQQQEKEYIQNFKDAVASGKSREEIKANGTHEEKIGWLLLIEDAALDDAGRDRVNLIANVPPEDVDFLRKEYISWVESDPTLLPWYRRHLQSTWGPIEIRSLSE